MITAGSLCLISAVAGVVFGVLPWIDLPLIPAPQEIARVERPGNHLVGYQIHSLYKPSEVLVCEEILLVEGVYWNDIHIRMHHAVDMQFAATGEQTWSCSFQHLHPGRSVRSRTLTLPQ